MLLGLSAALCLGEVLTSPLVTGESLFMTSANSGLPDVFSTSFSFSSLARLFRPGYLSL